MNTTGLKIIGIIGIAFIAIPLFFFFQEENPSPTKPHWDEFNTNMTRFDAMIRYINASQHPEGGFRSEPPRQWYEMNGFTNKVQDQYSTYNCINDLYYNNLIDLIDLNTLSDYFISQLEGEKYYYENDNMFSIWNIGNIFQITTLLEMNQVLLKFNELRSTWIDFIDESHQSNGAFMDHQKGFLTPVATYHAYLICKYLDIDIDWVQSAEFLLNYGYNPVNGGFTYEFDPDPISDGNAFMTGAALMFFKDSNLTNMFDFNKSINFLQTRFFDNYLDSLRSTQKSALLIRYLNTLNITINSFNATKAKEIVRDMVPYQNLIWGGFTVYCREEFKNMIPSLDETSAMLTIVRYVGVDDSLDEYVIITNPP